MVESESECGKIYTFLASAAHQINLISVERLEPTGSGRIMPPLWLVWTGERTMQLEEIWHQYLRRFGIEHWYRFAKQRLHWTMPSLKTPEQS